ncbi:MAG: aspartate aminotransferase family protein [Candidatus Promineifilaceae bacterium]
MNPNDIIQAEHTYVLHTYSRPDVVFTHGQGVYLYDTEGKQYLDFSAGIAVTSLGHSDPEWVTAVSQQATLLTHTSNLYHTAPQALLAKRLVENSFADRVFFCNSGAEANEAALKFARKWAQKEAGSSLTTSPAAKTKIVAFSGGFHGRTVGALSVTYKEKYRAPFEPLMPNVVFVPFNDFDAAAQAIDDETCAVIIEPIQGEGGVNPAKYEFLHMLRRHCNDHNALLIFDEVQCGLGRTGYLWAHQGYGVTPDIMTLAKPLAGGLPIGAALITQRVADAIQPGDHGSTFAGGALVCAAANVVFDRINQPEFLAHVQAMGQYLKEKLFQLAMGQVGQVRGAGLLIGVELDSPAAPVIAAARDKGLLVISAGENVLRLAPPLIVDKEDVDTAVDILAACLKENTQAK